MNIVKQLDPEQTIYQAAATYAELASALNQYSVIQLDLSNISDVDTTFLQILLWLQRESQLRNKTLDLLNLSSVLKQAIELLGLQEAFESHFGDAR
jgi:anti-sigma B factor antagonist